MSRVEVTQPSAPLSDGMLQTVLPLSATSQFVKDNVGNTSALSLSTGAIGVGGLINATGFGHRIRVIGTGDASIGIFRNQASGSPAKLEFMKSRGTYDVPLTVSANDQIGNIGFYGYDGTAYRQSAAINGTAVSTSATYVEGTMKLSVWNNTGSNFDKIGIYKEGVYVGDTVAVPTSQLQIRGKGATSATTSLLVQNSSGAAAFTVKDDGSISGGSNATASNSYSIAFGNIVTASGSQAAIAMGENVLATGPGSKCISHQSTVSSSFAGAFGGYGHSVSGSQAIAIGGISHTVSGVSSVCLGTNGTGYLLSQIVHGSSSFAQSSYLNAYRNTTLTTAATTVLSLDGTGVTGLIIPFGNFRAWNVQVSWVAVVVSITGTATGISAGDVITSVDLLAFKRVTGTSSVSSHTSAATKTMVTTPAAYAACAINYTAGASQEMAMTFTGPTFLGGGSLNMRVVAKVELAEVNFQL